jgi:hypothetical protein
LSDFLTVDTLFEALLRLVLYRARDLAGAFAGHDEPDGAWVTQQAESLDAFLRSPPAAS